MEFSFTRHYKGYIAHLGSRLLGVANKADEYTDDNKEAEDTGDKCTTSSRVGLECVHRVRASSHDELHSPVAYEAERILLERWRFLFLYLENFGGRSGLNVVLDYP